MDSNKIKLLCYDIENGQMGLQNYIEKKRETIGEIRTVRDIERVIGIISYAKKTIKGPKKILSILRQDIKELKMGKVSDQWFDMLNNHI